MNYGNGRHPKNSSDWSDQQMFYLSFCVFTLQISHVQPWHHLLHIKAPWDWGASGEDSRNYSMYRMNSPIGEKLFCCDRDVKRVTPRGPPRCYFLLMLQIDRLSSHRCSSIHDTLHELVQRFRLHSTAMFHFHSTSDVKKHHNDAVSVVTKRLKETRTLLSFPLTSYVPVNMQVKP